MTEQQPLIPDWQAPDSDLFINFYSSSLRPYLHAINQEYQYIDNQGLALDDQEYTGKSPAVHFDKMFTPQALSTERIDVEQFISLSVKEQNQRISSFTLPFYKHPRIMLLGDPGSGKTTLLRWLTLFLSVRNENTAKELLGNLLPLYIVARKVSFGSDVEISAQGFIDTALNSMGKTGDTLREADAYADFMTVLQKQQAIILLDGIDEIAINTRDNLVAQLKAFLNEYPGVKLIISSRIVGFNAHEFWGYQQSLPPQHQELEQLTTTDEQSNDEHHQLLQKKLAPLPELPIATFYIAPFDHNRRNVFIDRWTRQYLPNPAEQGTFKKVLVEACKNTPYLDALSRNPVLLTMICFIQWRVGQLPHGRAELYQRIVATYLVSLDRARATDLGYQATALPFDHQDIKFWLGKLAWQMQCGQLISLSMDNIETDSFPVFSKNMFGVVSDIQSRLTSLTETQLCQFLACQVAEIVCDELPEQGPPPQKAIEITETLIEFIKRRTGFLIPQGTQLNPDTGKSEEIFTFSHLSFQEYFAAYYLSKRWPSWQSDKNIKAFVNSTGFQSWSEVWQLAFEESDRKQQGHLLSQLFSHINSGQSDLASTIVFNQTLKLKLSDRKKLIARIWDKSLFTPTLLWTKQFDSLSIMSDIVRPTKVWITAPLNDVIKYALTSNPNLKALYLREYNDQVESLLISLKQLNFIDFWEVQNLIEFPHQSQKTISLIFFHFCPAIDFSQITNIEQLKEVKLMYADISTLHHLVNCKQLKKLDIISSEEPDASVIRQLEANGVEVDLDIYLK